MSLRRSYGAIALCLVSLSSYANEADIVIEIDSRSPTPVNEASPFSKVITREDIAQSGYQSLSEILAGSGYCTSAVHLVDTMPVGHPI